MEKISFCDADHSDRDQDNIRFQSNNEKEQSEMQEEKQVSTETCSLLNHEGNDTVETVAKKSKHLLTLSSSSQTAESEVASVPTRQPFRARSKSTRLLPKPAISSSKYGKGKGQKTTKNIVQKIPHPIQKRTKKTSKIPQSIDSESNPRFLETEPTNNNNSNVTSADSNPSPQSVVPSGSTEKSGPTPNTLNAILPGSNNYNEPMDTTASATPQHSTKPNFVVVQSSHIPSNFSSGIVQIHGRRINLDSLIDAGQTSPYALVRAWVQDDPFRQQVHPQSYLVQESDVPVIQNQPLLEFQFSHPKSQTNRIPSSEHQNKRDSGSLFEESDLVKQAKRRRRETAKNYKAGLNYARNLLRERGIYLVDQSGER